ncbi:MAG TPA: penicillin-binding transpeptidase domain-containing protein, partial [Gemmatimonadales bacterium]|nr:penicillin-binding transpeptidase domain-containing protein [Gemmatimonadales bacterium]
SEAIARVLDRFLRAPYQPALVMANAPADLVAQLEERRINIPGLYIQAEPRRYYPDSGAAAHLLGTVGEVTEDERNSPRYAGLRLGALVGKTGLEREYDDSLRGQDGQRFVEVSAVGRVVREVGAAPTLPPVPGAIIRTTIDLDLQRYVSKVFPPGQRGALIAMNPNTGEVLALYSAPGYDPNAFVGGIDQDTWKKLNDNPANPFFDRAIQARYPPGSTWKLLVAAIGLRRGIVTMNSRMPIPCTGGLQYGNRYFRCWEPRGHGDLTLSQAIAQSCDVYFYQLGLKLGLEPILSDGVLMGFRDRSGVDLMNEVRPRYPASAAYFDRLYGPRGWSKGVVLNLAIGQGEDDQTLINMMRFYAALAGNGTAAAPYLVHPDAGVARDLGLSPDQLLGLRRALQLVVDRGTASASRIADLEMAGKTGSAQNPHGKDHGWFIGFAPADHPQIIVGSIMEFAEHGASVAPYVARVIRRYVLGPASDERRAIRIITKDEAAAPQVVAPVPDSVAEDTTTIDTGDSTDADTTGGLR